jgi:SAM-dependent methyltransferase
MDPVGYDYPVVPVPLEDFSSSGLILDLGGGGEGVIGRLAGDRVFAIDLRMDELRDSPSDSAKVQMDASRVGFANCTFSSITAFFALMFMWEGSVQAEVFREAWRVLKPGGTFQIWDVSLKPPFPAGKNYYCVYLHYRIRDAEFSPGYGMRWPDGKRDLPYYRNLASKTGFKMICSETNQHCFYLKLGK